MLDKWRNLYKYYQLCADSSYPENMVKQCVLIAVDEIIEFGNQQGIREPMMYWNKVKQEILKL